MGRKRKSKSKEALTPKPLPEEPVIVTGNVKLLLELDPKKVALDAVTNFEDEETSNKVAKFADDLLYELHNARCDREDARELTRMNSELEKRRRFRETIDGCRGCGKKDIVKLTPCLCFKSKEGYKGGVTLCEDCVEKGENCRPCDCCGEPLCIGDDEDCAFTAIDCGRTTNYGETNCGKAICVNCERDRKEKWSNEWKKCFCGSVWYCNECANDETMPYFICRKCNNTLFCTNQMGRCGLPCECCNKAGCPTCNDVDPNASLSERRYVCKSCDSNITKNL
mmetsp:Transcript_18464/g.21239  ORF Transcript_18464/g.21239 Transcript_18464/m.21239 type:complete len:281 (-) Transcript_18464:151-993(-)